MDLFVGLSKLDRNGSEVLMAGYNDVEDGHVASGWLRVTHRELGRERSTGLRPFLSRNCLSILLPGSLPVATQSMTSDGFARRSESHNQSDRSDHRNIPPVRALV